MTASTAQSVDGAAYFAEQRLRWTEREFQREVVTLANERGWLTYHTHDSRRSDPGFPDLVLVKDRVIFAELKTTKGKVSVTQEIWKHTLALAGAEVYEWRPADWNSGVIDRVLL